MGGSTWPSLLLAAALAAGCGGCAGASGAGPSTGESRGTPANWRTLPDCPVHAQLGLAEVRGGALHLLDLDRCRQRVLVGHGASAPVAFSGDRRWLAFGPQPRVISTDGQTAPTRALAKPVNHWSLAPRGSALAAVAPDGSLRVFDPSGDRRTLLPRGLRRRGLRLGGLGAPARGRTRRLRQAGACDRAASRGLARRPAEGPLPRAPPRNLSIGAGRLLARRPLGVFWPDRSHSASLAADGMPLRVVSTRGGPTRTVVPRMLLNPDWISFCGRRAVMGRGVSPSTTSGS